MSKHTSLVIFMKSVLTHNFIIALGLKKIITVNNTCICCYLCHYLEICVFCQTVCSDETVGFSTKQTNKR